MHLLFGVENPASVVKDQPIKQITGILPATSIISFSSTISTKTGVQSSSFTLDSLPRSTSSFFTSNSDMENDNFNAIQLINNVFTDSLGFRTTQV